MADSRDRPICIGRISGVYGVRGWVKVHSHTEPRENVVAHTGWTLVQDGVARHVEVLEGGPQGKTIVARLAGIETRDAAETLVGAAIEIDRQDLPDCDPGQYYWADLEGLAVIGADGAALGRVVRLLATGAHDVLVLDSGPDRLVPFVPGEVVTAVDLDAGTIEVSWDASYWDA